MAKVLKCRDVVTGCDFEMTGSSEEEVTSHVDRGSRITHIRFHDLRQHFRQPADPTRRVPHVREGAWVTAAFRSQWTRTDT
jgi:predicted small metal-binding protein